MTFMSSISSLERRFKSRQSHRSFAVPFLGMWCVCWPRMVFVPEGGEERRERIEGGEEEGEERMEGRRGG